MGRLVAHYWPWVTLSVFALLCVRASKTESILRTTTAKVGRCHVAAGDYPFQIVSGPIWGSSEEHTGLEAKKKFAILISRAFVEPSHTYAGFELFQVHFFKRPELLGRQLLLHAVLLD